MFKNRKITVTVDKKNNDETPEIRDPRAFEEKAEFILHNLKKLGAMTFGAVCVYVMLDTHRQVKVAEASNPTE